MTEFLFVFSNMLKYKFNTNELVATLEKSMRKPLIVTSNFDHVTCVTASFVKNYPEIKNNEKEIEIVFDNYFKELENQTYEIGFRNSERITFNRCSSVVKIETSTWGLTHIYICSPEPGILVISSNFKNIFALYPNIRNKIDYDSIVEYLFSHAILGTKTYFHEILLCPPNSEISINLKTLNNNLKKWMHNVVKRINNLNYIKNADYHLTTEYLAKRIQDSIQYLYEKYNGSHFNLMLSGGLDSRVLAASIPESYNKKTTALTFDTEPNGREITKSSKIAEKLNLKHVTQVFTYKDILNFKEFHTWLSEGSSYIIVSSIHPLLKMSVSGFVLEGFLGDTQFGGEFFDSVDFSLDSLKQDELIEYFIKLNEDMGYSFTMEMFTNLFKEKDAEDILNVIINGYKSLFDLMWDSEDIFMLIECALFFSRGRRVTIGGTRAIEYYANDVKPFYDSEFISKVLLLLPEYRIKRKLEIDVLQKLNKNIGASASTSTSIYHKLPRLRKYVLSAINFIEKITRKRINPYYSRNSVRFWMRDKKHPFMKWIYDEILIPSNLIFNFVDYEQTKQMFEDYTKYKFNYFKNLTQFLDLESYFQIIYAVADNEYCLPKIENIEIISDVLKFKKFVKNPYL